MSFFNPDTGSILFFSDMAESSAYASNNMEWSPDGNYIIFSGNLGDGKGIYRMGVTDGSQPFLIFPDPSPNTIAPLFPHFYANGSRIVWSGQEDGDTSFSLWTIDLNGDDLQRLTSLSDDQEIRDVLH